MRMNHILLITVIILAKSGLTQSTDSTFQIAQPDANYSLLLDPGMTMRTGVENITTFHHFWSDLEDRWLRRQWFAEDNFIGKTGGLALRTARYIFLDTPVDYFLPVLAHEFWGHGAPYRKFGIENIHYAFDWPPPYGNGGGEASTSIPGGIISTHQSLAIWEGGMEIHPLLNRRLAMTWVARGEMNYRQASLYFWTWQINLSYIQDSPEDLGDGQNDNDPRAYVRITNSYYGYPDLNNLAMGMIDFKSKVKLNFLNPFVVYSMYAIIKTFLWDGNANNSLPMIPLGSVKYLPLLRMGVTPFGPDYHLENYLNISGRVAVIDVSIGDKAFYSGWGAIGISIANIWSQQTFSLDANLNFWHQPQIVMIPDAGPLPDLKTGAGFSVRGYYHFNDKDIKLSAVLELGYKTSGFIEGYPLEASPVIMFGFGLCD